MHFLTSLIIFSGFVFVFCLGLVQVLWDLSDISVHASPQMPANHTAEKVKPRMDTRMRMNRRVPRI
jgi:hypothetical protein